MPEPISIEISTCALLVSGLTAWLTFFRRGTVKMTRPAMVYFGPDSPRPNDKKPLPKVYLRALLFSDSKRGRVIENMYASLSRSETHQNFNVWVHGEGEKLVRGSGLFVGETGVAANHHFLISKDAENFLFQEGKYILQIFAQLLGDRQKICLFSHDFVLSEKISKELRDTKSGVYFDWGPSASAYFAHVEQRPPSSNAEEVLFFLKNTADMDKLSASDVP